MLTLPRRTALSLSVASAFPLVFPLATHPSSAFAQAQDTLEPVVVTAPPMETPMLTRVNTRTAQQPLPANDGASLLKSVPGMSVIRKGGTDGDLVFRGQAGSRVNVLIDGEQIMGGCGMRMDPPTAYVFPDAYDRVSLIKGPQTVLYGPGNSAATVLFERLPTRYEAASASLKAALTTAGFGRTDAQIDARAGTPQAYVQAIATDARSDDYRDGHGTLVHAAYERSSLTGLMGWTPDEDTRLEASAIESRGHAAYADRSMDGSRFDRSNVGLKFEKSRIGTVLRKIEAQAYYNYVDHVMDNYSLRTPPMNSAMRMASNPDRKTTGGRLAFTLIPDDQHKVVMGLDRQDNQHTVRASGMGGELMSPYTSKPRLEDARFDNLGLFGEVTHVVNDDRRVVFGLRQDRWHARDQRATLSSGMTSLGANPTAKAQRLEILPGGFARLEQDFGTNTQVQIGLGHTERAPDYWELISKESASSISAFNSVAPERTTQLDLGITHRHGPMQAFASAYYNQISDYVLIQTGVLKPSGMGTRSTTIARAIDARTVGLEGGVQYALSPQWMSQASLAYVNGQNTTDDYALGQMPPLETRWALDWDNRIWSAGALLRLVAGQHRYAVGQGNIVGQDLSSTAGFGVVSVHGGYRWGKTLTVSAGIDNLFDKVYAEAISRGGAAVSGYEQTTRVNEPGRLWWLKLQLALN